MEEQARIDNSEIYATVGKTHKMKNKIQHTKLNTDLITVVNPYMAVNYCGLLHIYHITDSQVRKRLVGDAENKNNLIMHIDIFPTAHVLGMLYYAANRIINLLA